VREEKKIDKFAIVKEEYTMGEVYDYMD